jgi:hypothetical protein
MRFSKFWVNRVDPETKKKYVNYIYKHEFNKETDTIAINSMSDIPLFTTPAGAAEYLDMNIGPCRIKQGEITRIVVDYNKDELIVSGEIQIGYFMSPLYTKEFRFIVVNETSSIKEI